jgi:hypothetical protein
MTRSTSARGSAAASHRISAFKAGLDSRYPRDLSKALAFTQGADASRHEGTAQGHQEIHAESKRHEAAQQSAVVSL